jgi:hypothetical protein
MSESQTQPVAHKLSSLSETWFDFSIDLIELTEDSIKYCQERDWTQESQCVQHGMVGANSDHTFTEEGKFRWRLSIELDLDDYRALGGPERRKLVETRLHQAFAETLRKRNPDHTISRLSVLPFFELLREVTSAHDEVNNQGRGHSFHLPAIGYQGLRFRSRSEVYLFKALQARGALVAPLPVFLKANAARKRVEPDFVVIKDGIVLVVEVDGASHEERPVDAYDRLVAFEEEGCYVRRVDAADCNSDAQAEKVADRILEYMAKLKFSKR